MELQDKFIEQGFSVVNSEMTENKLLAFLKENYPQIIKDGEINLQELKTFAGLPIELRPPKFTRK
jgi:hypothetical protein